MFALMIWETISTASSRYKFRCSSIGVGSSEFHFDKFLVSDLV